MSFIFGGNTGETPQSIARKRAVAQAMQARSLSRMPQNVGEGINSVGQALAAKIIERRASEAEAKGREGAGAAFETAIGEGAGVDAAYKAIGNPHLSEGQRSVLEALIARQTPRYEKVGDNLIKIGPDGVTPVYEGFDKDKALLGALGPDGLPRAAAVEYGLAADGNTQANIGSKERIAQFLEGGRMDRHATASGDARLTNETSLYKHDNASAGDKLSASVSTANNARTVGATMRGQDISAATSRENNVRSVSASIANNQRSTAASRYGTDVGAATAAAGRAQAASQFESMLPLHQQKADAASVRAEAAKSGKLGTQVNVGGDGAFKIPPSFMQDPEDPMRVVPIPNSPADHEARERARQQQATVDGMKDTLAVIQRARAHPGKAANFGMTGVIPNRPGGDAADFKTHLQQLQGKAFLQAFESLKGAGQITEVEGVKATQAIARLGTAQSVESFDQGLAELEAIVTKALANNSAVNGEASASSVAGDGWEDLGGGVRIRKK